VTVTPLVAINFFVDKPRHALRRLLTTRSESDTPLAATTLPHEYLGAPKYANEAKIAVGTIYCSIYYRTMLCISADYAVERCLSVRPSVRLSAVTRRYSVETDKRIIKLFHRRAATLFIPNGMTIFQRESP